MRLHLTLEFRGDFSINIFKNLSAICVTLSVDVSAPRPLFFACESWLAGAAIVLRNVFGAHSSDMVDRAGIRRTHKEIFNAEDLGITYEKRSENGSPPVGNSRFAPVTGFYDRQPDSQWMSFIWP